METQAPMGMKSQVTVIEKDFVGLTVPRASESRSVTQQKFLSKLLLTLCVGKNPRIHRRQ